MVEKAVDAEPKAGFRPHFYTSRIDQYCAQVIRLGATKSHAQDPSMKDPRA